MADLGWVWLLVLGLVALAAVLFLLGARRRALSPPGERAYQAPAGKERIVPDPPPQVPAEDEESLDVWGFRDTRYFVNDRGQVEISGSRYELSGCELPNLAPWIHDVMGVKLDPRDLNASGYPPPVPEPRINEAFLAELERLLQARQVSHDPRVRLRHGHGHTQEEMYAIKYGTLERVPDLVVYPEDEDQVAALVQAALRHDVCLIPYGGGTNVTNALRCPEDETRTIVSVDMQRMNRILWIDPVNRMARIQAGAVGRTIMSQLERYGLTMGHEPDSVEFSTLGGWVATHCSGMKKNRYGNIEDLVLDVTVVTPQGKLERSAVAPRESVGVDPRRWLYGSEGNFGIVTGAVVKVFPLPEVQRFGSIVFPSYEDGIAFMYDLAREGDLPASVRLVDNMQFQFSMALKPRATGWRAVKSRVEKWAITHVLGYDPRRMVACTLLFEGRRREVSGQRATVHRLARRHGGMKAGGENGRRGYQLTFSIAYIRDFVMNHYLLGESFETSVPWDRILDVCRNVETRLLEEHRKRKLPGRPFLCSRVTQIYQTGVCVYFYFGVSYKGVEDPSRVYAEMEFAARQAILDAGGSLSHHHGIGKIRERFLPQIMSPAVQEWNRSTKRAVDPRNVFGSRNQGVISEPTAAEVRPMRAMVLQQVGGGRLEEVDLPRPEPAPGQVLIEVAACGVCRTDLHVVDGDLAEPKLPIVPGHEIVGRVAATGEGETGFEPGTRVGVPWLGFSCGECRHCRRGQENLCAGARYTGYQVDGGFAEYTVADQRYVFPLPEGPSDSELAPLLCAGLIGYRSYRMAEEPAGGMECLGLYGFGAAAHIICQVALHQGKRVYAFTRPGDDRAQSFARDLGAVWAGSSEERPPVELDAAILFAPVGALVPAALRAVAPGGTVVCAGIHMSEIPAFPYRILWEERVVRSVANVTRRDAEEFLRLAPRVPVKTSVIEYPLSGANRALDDLREGRFSGAAVLLPGADRG